MKQHIPWRQVKSNPFNKDRFKGNNEVVEDWDLETTLYVYEPQTFAELRKGGSTRKGDKKDVEESYKKYNDGGYYFINLVPFKEQPTIKVTITSKGGDIKTLQNEEVLAGYTNTVMPEGIVTKRIYSLVPLDSSVPMEVKETLWEENNESFIINTDNTTKQVSFTLNKILNFQREADSLFFDRKFYVNNPIPKDIKYVNLNWKGGMPVIGETTVKNVKNGSIAKELLLTGDTYKFINNDNRWEITNNPWHPQYIEPIVTDNGVRWQPLWVWEWQYARAQFEGKVYWHCIGGGSNPNNLPSQNAASGRGIDLTGDYLYNRASDYRPAYHEIKTGGSLIGTGAGKQLDFLLPYGTQFALKSELSCHRMLFVATSDQASGSGLLGMKYKDNSHNGARSFKTTGKWGSKSVMMAWDYAYDPSSLFVLGKAQIYMSKIEAGVFRHSDGWVALCNEIMEGNIAYGGTSWSSELGVLENIKDVNLGGDVAKIAANGKNKMMLFPKAIEEIGGENEWATDNMLNAVPVLGEVEPKIDLGVLDFSPAQIVTNDIQGFYGSYIREEFNINDDTADNSLCLSLKDESTIGQIMINYHGGKKLTIKLAAKEDDDIQDGNTANVIKEYEFDTEYAANRQISGGVSISWF